MNTRSSRVAAMAFAALSAWMTAGLFAQEATEEVVVIGTRGESREVLDSPVPVDVISSADLQNVASLGGELGELLQALSPSFNFPRQSNSGSADHIRAAQLRGMSPDQVLVLVNGKRQHTTSVVNLESTIGIGTTPFDFNTIPAGAIERIEILRDGAGAQYGSDAIAGVINIVLKSAPSGGSVSATYGAHRTDFDPTGETLTDGHTFAVSGDYGVAVGNGGSFRFGAEYRSRNSTNRAGVGVLPFFEDQTPANLALSPARLFAPGDGETEDLYAFYNAVVPNGAGDFYSFGRYAYRDAEGAAFFRWPDGFSGVPAVFPEGYRPVTTGENNDFSVTGGQTLSIGQSDLDLSVTVGRNDYEFGVENSINPSFGAASATAFDLAGFEFTQYTGNADVVRDIETRTLAAPLQFAYGAELRYETYDTSAGDPQSFLAGPLAATAAVGAVAGPGLPDNATVTEQRFVYAAYIDVEAALTEQWDVGAAVRYEDYDDFGDALTGKLTSIFHFSDRFAVRAAAGTNFRAPALAQTAFAFFTTDFGAGGMLETFGHLPVSDPLAIANGATGLTEEESLNLSAGIVWEIGDTVNLTVDYFQIDVDDRITLVQGSTDNVTFFSNLVDTETTGVDIVVSGTHELGPGALSWTAGYNNSDTDVDNPAVLGEEDLNNLEAAPPDDKIILSADYDFGNWSVFFRATRFGETTRNFDFGGGFPDPQTFGDEWSMDFEVGTRVADAWYFGVGADNAFDQYSDLSTSDNNFFDHLPYDVLSGIGMNGAYYYARVRYEFD